MHLYDCYQNIVYEIPINFIDIQITFAGAKVDNNSVIYFDEISEQTGIVCYTTNSNASCEAYSPQVYVIGDWYFPNGEPIPPKQASSSLFTVRKPVAGTASTIWSPITNWTLLLCCTEYRQDLHSLK